MKRLCRLVFFISVFFVFFLFETTFVNACEWQDSMEYGRICGGNCPSGTYCTNSSGTCVCRVGTAPTNTPRLAATPTTTTDECGTNSDCPSCDLGSRWCDTGSNPNKCRCSMANYTPTPGVTISCGAWGACANYGGNDYCTKTRRCGDSNYETVVCSCGSNPTDAPEPTNTPMPTLFPTSAISGNLYVKNASVCSSYPAAAVTPAIRLVPQYPQGVTPVCTANPSASTYSCNISYDNRAASPPLSQNFTLSSTAQTYGAGNWFTGNLCTGSANNTRTIAVGNSSNTNWHIFFRALPWFKIQNGSFSSSNLSFSIPAAVTKFDSDDLGGRYLVDGESGTVTTDSTFPAATTLPISEKNWSKENYSYDQLMTPTGWLSYIKSRKKFTTITGLNEVTKDGIYYYNGDLSISQAPDFNVVLVVNGAATITDNLTQTSGFALAATGQINIDSSVTQINGVFVTPNFDTGGATTGLKVVGNISAATMNNDRDLTDNSKPSVFILFDPNTYLKLLPYLSISKYDWRQTQ